MEVAGRLDIFLIFQKKMQFLMECQQTLPPPAYTALHTMFVAVKIGIVDERTADESVLYLLNAYPVLLEQYNQIMYDSACRKSKVANAALN